MQYLNAQEIGLEGNSEPRREWKSSVWEMNGAWCRGGVRKAGGEEAARTRGVF